VLEECPDEILSEREKHWIATLNTNIAAGGNGYNLNEGGQTQQNRTYYRSHTQTPATREKIRQAHLGRNHIGWRKVPVTDEERANKSRAADAQKVRVERWSLDDVRLDTHDSLSAAVTWLIERGLASPKTGATTIKQAAVHNRIRFGFKWRLA
jgi:hypothetical protein